MLYVLDPTALMYLSDCHAQMVSCQQSFLIYKIEFKILTVWFRLNNQWCTNCVNVCKSWPHRIWICSFYKQDKKNYGTDRYIQSEKGAWKEKKTYSRTKDIITFFPVVHLMLIGTSVLCNKSQISISMTTA